MSVETIYPRVRAIIAEVLVIDESEVSLDKRLIEDLGAESIDFLDLVFQLEREFKIKIPRGQLEKNARGSLSEEAFAKDGVITEEGMVALRAYFSDLPESYFKAKMKTDDIPRLFTVGTFCKVVVDAQAEQAASTQE